MLEDVVHETDDFINRIRGHVDTIVLDSDLISVSSTLDNTTTIGYTAGMTALQAAAQSACRDLDPSNEMMFLRVRTTKHEFLIASDNEVFTIITVQNLATWNSCLLFIYIFAISIILLK